jgi:hypothetical protein
MRPIIPVRFLICFLVFCSATSTLAEDSYKWKDPDGKTVYGSKPPANAREVQRFSTRKLSRYSSRKVLERAESSSDMEEQVDRESGTGEIFEDRRIAPPVKVNKTRSIVSGQPSDLKPLAPKIKVNQLGEITSCKVEVLNEGELSVQDVSVAFEFFDGTLIPGAGPFVIPPGGKEQYEIPEALLPLYFSVGDLPEGEEDIPLPQVIVHGSLY